MKIIYFALALVSLSAYSSEVIFVGDTGKDNQGQKDVAQAIQKSCINEACSFGILAGDNIYPEGLTSEKDTSLEKYFDKHYNPLNIPFLVALGNHDYGKRARDWQRGAWQIAHASKNPNFYIPHFWYTYETEEAIFAVIDTSRIFWKKDREEQAKMVSKTRELAQASNKWFIVVGHHPYLSNGEHGNAGNYEGWGFPFFVSGSEIEKFVEKNICGKADFYLSGHDHNLQVFDGNIKNCNTQLIVSGSGAASTPLEGKNQSLFQSEELGFFRLSIERDKLRVRAFDAQLKNLFEMSFNR